MAKMRLEGLYPAMIAPFTSRGELDIDGLQETARFLMDAGCSGIVCNGSTGEAANLSREERIKLIETTRKVVGGNVTVIAGTGSPTTRQTVSLCKDAREAGADAVLVITPFNVIPNKEGLYQHYAAIAEMGIPVILYNLPEHTGVVIGFDTMERLLAKYDTIIGIKESSGDLAYFAEIMRRFGKQLTPVTGADALFFQTTAMGSPAAILALGNIAPRMIIEVMNLTRRGDIQKAKEIYYKLIPIARSISDSVNFPAPVKAAVEMLGRAAGSPRLPTLPVDREERDSIRQALEYADLL
jgi:4-hydroxy-tetrahydrodipicolinate synthase